MINKLIELIKRYKFTFVMIVIVCLLLIFDINKGLSAINTINYSIKEMILVIPPVFILLGLMDVWVPREVMVKHMGENSGFKGIILSILLGSFAAGPLYGAFPIASVFMKKGVKFTNVLIFIGAWSTTKIPMFLFEAASLGQRFAIIRLLLDIPGVIIIAYVLNSLISQKEVEEIYKKAEEK